MVVVYSESLARTPIKIHKDDEIWPLFVNYNSCFGGPDQQHWTITMILANFLTLYFTTDLTLPD